MDEVSWELTFCQAEQPIPGHRVYPLPGQYPCGSSIRDAKEFYVQSHDKN